MSIAYVLRSDGACITQYDTLAEAQAEAIKVQHLGRITIDRITTLTRVVQVWAGF